METKQIAFSSLDCLDCGQNLISHHRHDYNSCGCDNSAFIDGGTAYVRYGAKDLNKVKLFTVFADDDFSLVRQYAERGGRGINGDEPLTWTKLCDMNDDWLKAVVEYGGEKWHIDLIKKEIQYRKDAI